MSDLLAQYRKKSHAAPGDAVPPKGPQEYIAFDAKDRVDRLKIRRANDPTRSPGYHYLLDVVYDGAYGTNFVLLYTYMMVMVRGRNLQPVIAALEMSTADFIQEFDADRWQKPQDEKAAIIESIEVVIQENGPSLSESDKSGKGKEPGRSLH